MANHIEGEITIESEDGVKVPIQVTIAWPEHMGYYALHAVKRFSEFSDLFMEATIRQLAANGDTSVLSRLADDDTEDEDEEVEVE